MEFVQCPRLISLNEKHTLGAKLYVLQLQTVLLDQSKLGMLLTRPIYSSPTNFYFEGSTTRSSLIDFEFHTGEARGLTMTWLNLSTPMSI